MRCSNHPSSNQAFPLLISYQFCGFWKLSFNIFTQVFLQVIWEKENTSSTTGWKLWKLCFKSQDIKLKKGQKLDQNLPWYSTALNWKYQKDTHSPPALQFLWPFFVVLFSHFPINCSTFSCCIVETHMDKAGTYPTLKRVMDDMSGPSMGHIPADKHFLILSQPTFYVLLLSQVLNLALVSWIQTELLSFCSVFKAFSIIWLKLTGTTRLYVKRNYCC